MNDRIRMMVKILEQHQIRQDFNHPGYGCCYCGFNPEGDEDLEWWVVQAGHQAEQIEEQNILHDFLKLRDALPREQVSRLLSENP